MQPLIRGLSHPRTKTRSPTISAGLHDNVRAFHTGVRTLPKGLHISASSRTSAAPRRKSVPRPLAWLKSFSKPSSTNSPRKPSPPTSILSRRVTVLNLQRVVGADRCHEAGTARADHRSRPGAVKEPQDHAMQPAPASAACVTSARRHGRKFSSPSSYSIRFCARIQPALIPGWISRAANSIATKLVKIAERSDMNEIEVAAQTLALATRGARRSPRLILGWPSANPMSAIT